MTPVELSPSDFLIAASSLLIASALSVRLSLRMHVPLVVAALRMIAQLVLVGIALRYVIAASRAPVTLSVAVLMIAAAVHEVHSRQKHHFSGWRRYGLGGLPVAVSAVFITGLALTTALRQDEWLAPQHAIPLIGIILGTVLNSTSLALNTMLDKIHRERRAIEAQLLLGADRRTALREISSAAAHNGLIPVINQMAGAGIITLPGIMTGQILAGMDPLIAARYQILLMLLLAGAGALSVVIATRLCIASVTDHRHRLRLGRVARD